MTEPECFGDEQSLSGGPGDKCSFCGSVSACATAALNKRQTRTVHSLSSAARHFGITQVCSGPAVSGEAAYEAYRATRPSLTPWAKVPASLCLAWDLAVRLTLENPQCRT